MAAGEGALRAEVRAAVAEHLEPVLIGFGPRMRGRERAPWGMVADEAVEGCDADRVTKPRAAAVS